MNPVLIIFKSILLAFFIFWLLILPEFNDADTGMLILLSIIPISICCTVTILLTVFPFFKLKSKTDTNRMVFKKWFPFYAIVGFAICFYGCLNRPGILAFFVSAYITSLQSWVWFTKDKIIQE